jgi:hypothetical protein
MTAARTEAIELEAVGLNGEAVAGGDFLLQFFDFAVFKFDNFSTTGANKMIVMTFMRDVIVLGLRAKVSRLGESRVTKQVQGPVNGGQPKMWISFSELVIHGLRRDMFLPKKRREDQFPLTGELQLMFSEMFFQYLHFLGKFARPHADRLLSDVH